MKTCYINTDIIKNNTNEIKNSISKINNIFEEIDKAFLIVEKDENWLGPTSERIFKIHNSLVSNYGVIIDSLNSFNNFVDNAADKYIEFDNTISNKIENDINLDIN